MGPYRLLFTIDVEHGYFDTEPLPGLRLVPTCDTAALLGHPALLCRESPWGLEMYQGTGHAEALERLAEAHDGAFRFCFHGKGGPPGLADVSEAFLFDGHATAALDSAHAVREDDGRWRLHREALVTERDMVPRDAVTPDPPLFTVRIDRRPLLGDGEAPADPPDRYRVRFSARRTYWKYYVLGTLRTRALGIVDLDDRSRFEPLGETTLSNTHPALAFRSVEPIALRARSRCRFQLRERGANAERVLIKRLPVAGADPVVHELVGEAISPVSEIYVNG